MKQFVILLILFFATTIVKAQQGLLYITSYDDTGQIVYICGGEVQNPLPVQFVMVNLTPSIPITVDSIIPTGDSNAFPYLDTSRVSFELGEFSGGGALFSPKQVGSDTLYLTVYYNGQYTETASIILHARSSPNISMYGYVWTIADVVGSNSFGEQNTEEVTDTMFDLMQPGIDQWYYYTGDAPTKNGGSLNEQVVLRSCGGAIIDSINESGDFSEFAFDSMPSLPDTLRNEDSLLMDYEFSPKTIDTQGIQHHYLIFHTTDGHYMTWSFKYFVYPTASVSFYGSESSNGIRIFPNPATNELHILSGPVGTGRLFDPLGRERAEISDDGSGATLDISHIEAGAYLLRIGNQSAKVEIAR